MWEGPSGLSPAAQRKEGIVPRKDPLEAYRAQGTPAEPVGTLDELIAHNLPTRIFPSCCEPSADETVRGCDHWYECTMSYRGLPAAEGGGPRNHAWERIKAPENGGGIVRNTQACYWGVAGQETAGFNKEILRPIADEGEEYEVLTSVPDESMARDPKSGCFEKWDMKLSKVTVTPFVRIGQDQKLAKHELRASIIQREKKKVSDERAAKLLGVPGNETPLDKRGRSGREDPAKKG